MILSYASYAFTIIHFLIGLLIVFVRFFLQFVKRLKCFLFFFLVRNAKRLCRMSTGGCCKFSVDPLFSSAAWLLKADVNFYINRSNVCSGMPTIRHHGLRFGFGFVLIRRTFQLEQNEELFEKLSVVSRRFYLRSVAPLGGVSLK